MDGHLVHGQADEFIPDDMVFDDLINTTGWPSSSATNQYTAYHPQPNHTPQNTYSPYQPPSQPTYQYDLPRQSYSPMPYSNSPYVSQLPPQPQPQSQYQPPSRTSHDYNTSYASLDPSLHHSSPYQPSNASYLYPQQQAAHPTVSPNSLYANPVSQLQQVNRSTSNSPYPQQASNQVNSFDHGNQHHAGSYYNSFQYESMPQPQAVSVQYPKLPPSSTPTERAIPNSTYNIVNETLSHTPQINRSPQPPQPAQASPPYQPTAVTTPSTVRITHPDLLAVKDTTLKHPMNHAPFAVFMKVAVPGATPPGAKG